MRADMGGEGGLGPGTLLLMIAAACLLLANLCYPQPILGEVARALGLPEAASGAVVTAGQLGYIAGRLHTERGRITAFALAGLVTPPCMLLVGRLLDKGLGREILLASLGCGLLAWLLPLAQPAWFGLFMASALVLDPSSSAVTVSIQQKTLSGAPTEIRGRLNSLNISMNFLGGAAGAALGPFVLARCGLTGVLPAGALLLGCLLCCALKAR